MKPKKSEVAPDRRHLGALHHIRRKVLLLLGTHGYALRSGIVRYAREADWILDDTYTNIGIVPVWWEGDGILAFEPRAGGRLWTTLPSGAQFEIGRISRWEPGARLVFSWRQASFAPEQSTEVEVQFEGVGTQTRISVEHRAWDTIPQRHVARHGFPEHSTLQHVANWWRASLNALKIAVLPS